MNVTIPTPLDIARKELHAAEEACKRSTASRPIWATRAWMKRREAIKRVVDARRNYAAAHHAEFGQGGEE